MKGLRVPERLFAVVMWLVSVAFAAFLIGLGRGILADLPRLESTLAIDAFVSDPAALDSLRADRTRVVRERSDAASARQRRALETTATANAVAAAEAEFRNWIAARTATTDPGQDPEVIGRTRALDQLTDRARVAEAEVEALDQTLLTLDQVQATYDAREAEMIQAARRAFERAEFWQELRVFLVRLAFTLPLLMIAGWLVARRRRADYWPLMRGFVLFAVFTFFVELVPYLPSYGGYVRNGVGVIVTIVAGHYLIRSMRRYLARRQDVERQTESARRQALRYEDALKKMAANVCPGCERAIQTTGEAPSNFCVHCGMTLYDTCDTCSTRKNVFFQYCPSCGTHPAPA
jgi:predicted RNA-binding Zn-ribbon protein involved in translation (DUF1610 family)